VKRRYRVRLNGKDHQRGKDPVWSNYSCGVGVVLEQAAEPRSAMNPAFEPMLADFMAWKQQDVAFPLGFVSAAESV